MQTWTFLSTFTRPDVLLARDEAEACDSETAAHSSAGDVEVMWSDGAHERPPDSYFHDFVLVFIIFQVVLTARGPSEI